MSPRSSGYLGCKDDTENKYADDRPSSRQAKFKGMNLPEQRNRRRKRGERGEEGEGTVRTDGGRDEAGTEERAGRRERKRGGGKGRRGGGR